MPEHNHEHNHCACGHDHHHGQHHDHGCCEAHDHDHDHGCGCGHDHDHGDEGQGRKILIRIAAAAALAAAGFLVPGWVGKLLLAAAHLTAGYDVLLRAGRNILRGRIFDENFLMSVASLGALLMGEYAEAAAVMILYQAGEYFQAKAVHRSRASIAALMDLRPDSANLLEEDGAVRTVSPEEVLPGSLILIKPGEKVPLDGVVVDGASSLNTAALTGESLPRDVQCGDSILSGSVNLTALLTVRTSLAYHDSTVARILNLVENSGKSKARTERFISRFARVYTPLVCLAAVLLAVIPSLLDGQWQQWIHRALSFLVISCPCALVISVPLTFYSGVGAASRRGVLVKGASHLETLAALKTVVFDKTGTLTRGVFTVTELCPSACTEQALLETAALAECYSDHPISISLREAWKSVPDPARVSGAREIPGQGLSALVDGETVLCGNLAMMKEAGLAAPEVALPCTVVYVARAGQYLGHILISDQVKPASATAIRQLKELGVEQLIMLTGDRQSAADAVAEKLGLTGVWAQQLPADKVARMEELLSGSGPCAFCGDGINDAPVLRRADVGIAMGGMGSDAAIEAADVVLMDDDPLKLPQAIRIARRTIAIARQNIAFALSVKLAVMLMGALGFASMWLAVFADVGVCMLAILNAVRGGRS